MRGNWGDGISLFSGIVSVRQHKDQRSKRDDQPELQDDDVSPDIRDVLALKSSARLKWLQRALVLAGTGKMKTALLYDILTHPKFVARSGSEFRAQLGEFIEANLHLFSSKQQRTLLSEVKASCTSSSTRRRRSRSRSGSSQGRLSPGKHRSRSRHKQGGDRKPYRSRSRDTVAQPASAPPPQERLRDDSPAAPPPQPRAEARRAEGERRWGRGDAPVLSTFLVMPPALPGPQAGKVAPAPAAEVEGPAEQEEEPEAPPPEPARLKQAAAVASAAAKAASIAARNLRMAAMTAASAAVVKEKKAPQGTADAAPGGQRTAGRSEQAGSAGSGVGSVVDVVGRRPKSPAREDLAEPRRSARGSGRAASPASGPEDGRRHARRRSRRRGDSRRRKARSSPGREGRRGDYDDAPAAGAETRLELRAAGGDPREKPRREASRSRPRHRDKVRASSSNWDSAGPGASSARSAFAPSQGNPLAAAAPLTGAAAAAPDAAQQLLAGPTVKVASPFYRFLTIPVSQVGVILGPRGASITAIRQASGADIKVDQPAGKLYATVAISGKGVEVAEKFILDKLALANGVMPPM